MLEFTASTSTNLSLSEPSIALIHELAATCLSVPADDEGLGLVVSLS